jgi:2-dehydropantoate 2-reductase
MKIAVIGPGAIGGLVAAYLSKQGEDVSLVGRKETLANIRQNGMKISGVRGEYKANVHLYDTLVSRPDLLILATKTQDIEQALVDCQGFIKDSLVITVQNGIQADGMVARFVPKENIISSIVMFGSTFIEPGVIVHNFEGPWILGNMFGPSPNEKIISASLLLDEAFQVVISENIKGMKYLKVFVNANNCLPAILGKSMQEVFSDLDISKISIAIWREGFEIISASAIELVSLPGFPIENVTRLLSVSSLEASKIFSGIMTKLSKDPVYGSILQSIKRGRASEIDYINGEFTALAQHINYPAVLNQRLIELVHRVEITGKFLSKDELMAEVLGLIE